MTTHIAILKNGGVPTKPMISQVLLILDYLTHSQITDKTQTFHPMVTYANYLICIFININENINNEGREKS